MRNIVQRDRGRAAGGNTIKIKGNRTIQFWREIDMRNDARGLPRRHFCFCCLGGAALAATGEWLTPQQAFAEARGIVSLIKDSAATSPIVTHKLRNNIAVLQGSGGNMAVLTGPDGKVFVDAGIGVSRAHISEAL